jgi:phosphohistidine swiveling domain-containing protein
MNAHEWVFVPEPGAAVPPVGEVGGKGHHLARLLVLEATGADFRVPRFVVVGTVAFDRWVLGAAPWPVSEADADRRRAEVEAIEIPPALRAEILEGLAAQRLMGARVAVRSSAASEDGSSASFAGQFETVLGVNAGDEPEMWNALRSVWASAFLARAAAYRAERAGAGGGVQMAVVIQELVDPDVSGVAFSADPVSGDRDSAVVSAVYGLGEGLVSGELDADAYRVGAGPAGSAAVSATLAHKDRALRAAPGGRTRSEEVPKSLRDSPALTDEEARRVATCARALAVALGAPQDVEWALVSDGRPARELVVLQTRPITTLSRVTEARTSGAAVATVPNPDPSTPRRGERRVWDNSNIIESYGGVTTPLTFTFARRVYEDVYRQFCRLMGVSEPLIETHRHVLANMLGLVRGRVYYNLLNWYRTLGLLPGFAFNRGFMERMMGVRESLEDPPPPPSAGGRVRDLAQLVRMVLRMVRESGKLGAEVPAFHARVQATLAPLSRKDLGTLSEAEVVATYHGLERDLLRHWRPPLVNDFFAMIFFGVLCRLIEKWLPGIPLTVANDLLCGEGGIISTEPARQVMALARRVAGHPGLARWFAEESDAVALLRRLREEPEFAGFYRAFEEYVERFGDRCLEELKLETVTLREDPRFLLQMIRSYAACGTVDPDAQRAREKGIRAEAEALVASRLHGMRRALFFWVLHRARRRVRDRENLRFERTRVFGMVRRLFLALGDKFARSGRIESARDVFYLTIEELFAVGEGGGDALDLVGLVKGRRAEFASFERGPAPPDRFETRGTPAIVFGAEGVAEGSEGTRPLGGAGAKGRELQGTGCCPGVVRERVRVVRDPREAHDVAGRILVAERTDPGWTLLFPAARGLLVQRGSLLSHSAIVAREMGLPCVVGIAGLLDTLRDGEQVEMDGSSGRIVRLDAGEAVA